MRRRRTTHRTPPLPFPSEPPPNVVAFLDQVEARIAAGELPASPVVHFDVCALPGERTMSVLPRLCTAIVADACDGGCSR